MEQLSGATDSYDEVPYDSYPFAQSHPFRLATQARLFGMTPTHPRRARVLELGCASGGNLLPLAEVFPEATIVGLDASARQIEQGHEAIRVLGYKNIELRHANILDIDESLGTFDYIIAHGVYSWVPDDVQRKLLDICSKNLAEQGVAYVSYNTFPGWRLRGMIRDLMSYRARFFPIRETS
jgi:SAM-dependent methyltransferase